MNHLHRLEAIALAVLALLHVLAQRLDRLLWPSPSPAAGRTMPPLASMTTVQLRRIAQQQGIRSAGDRRASKARRGDLIAALA